MSISGELTNWDAQSILVPMAKHDFSAIILAAGKGTRMKSPLPKVLHPVAGYPMLYRVVKAIFGAGAKEVRVVVGYGEELVRKVVEPLGAVCFRQEVQKGTAHAVLSARPDTLSGNVLILNGDQPLITEKDIESLVVGFSEDSSDLSVVTSHFKSPGSLGRIVRHHGELRAIVEAKDASEETRKISEINVGMYMAPAELLSEYLPQIHSHNVQNEYYLTDIVALCQESGKKLGTLSVSPRVAFGVNSQAELARATRVIFQRKLNELMDDGVVIIDPNQTYIEDGVTIGEASVIYPGTYIKGKTHLGRFCVVESHCYINSCRIDESVEIKAGSYLEDTEVKSKATLGPYARLRPKTFIGVGAKVGNFVEMKKVKFGDRSKASHLTYLGDAEIGEDTNIGCGTITCNYAADHKKYVTKIGKNVFVGSDTQFIAPVTIGDDSVIASGSTITKSVPAGALAVARGKQYIKDGYKAKVSSDKKEKS